MIGVLLPDLHGEFFSEVIRGIDLAARREGLHVLVSSSHADTGELVTTMRAMRADSVRMLERKRACCSRGIPSWRSSAAPRMAESGLFNSWVRVWTYSSAYCRPSSASCMRRSARPRSAISVLPSLGKGGCLPSRMPSA